MALSAGLASIDVNNEETWLVGFHGDQKGDKGPIWHGENENNAIRPAHGLPRGTGADELAHQEPEIVAGDVEQVTFVDVLAATQVGSSHAATVQDMGKRTLA